MKRSTKVVLSAVVLIILLAFYFLNKTNISDDGQAILVGGDRDAHQCIGSAGYSWCGAKDKCLRVFEEFCPDAVSEILKDIKNATGISLTSVGESEFEWRTPEIKMIDGVKYENVDMKFADYNKVEKYLSEKYEIDNNNVADGVSGGLRGYKVGYIICNLNFKHNKLIQTENAPTVPDGDSLTVSLACGFYNENIK